MNKRQTVWLIVRLIGVYFGYWAIVSLLSLVGAIYNYSSLPAANNPTSKQQQTIQVNGISIPTTAPRANQSATTTPGVESPADKAKSDALKEVLWQFFLTVIFGGIGFYLTRNGKILSTVLNREELTDETDETASVSSVKPKEKVVTTLDFSSGKKEEVTSLNLSEYVPKKAETAPPIAEKVEEINQPEVSVPNIEQKPEISLSTDEQTWENLEITPPIEEVAQVETVAEQTAPIEQIEPPNVSDEQIAPVINEQPNEPPAPSDVPADAPLDEKK